MGLETATYINGLSSSWPTAGEPKSQGDDHLRLIKTVLVNTFPNATLPFRFPTVTVASTPQVLSSSDQNKTVMLSTAGGDVAVTLPSLVAGDAGWACEIMKSSTDTNGIVVTPASGNITSRVGSTASIRVGQVAEPAKLFWSGTAWFCFKPGMPIGTVISFDGATVPAGFLTTDGSAVPAAYIELIAVNGSTLKDRKGRVDAGVDAASLRLSITHFGATPTFGAVGGLESNTLSAVQSGIAQHSHTVFINEGSGHSHGVTGGIRGGTGTYTDFGNFGGINAPLTSSAIAISNNTTGMTIGPATGAGAVGNVTGNAAATAAANAHNNTQPTLIAHRIIRAC